MPFIPDLPQPSAYDKTPAIPLGPEHRAWAGDAAWQRLIEAAEVLGERPVLAIDTYPGVDLAELKAVLAERMPGFTVIDVEDRAARPNAEIETMIAANLTDDRVFGVLSHLRLDAFYDHDRLSEVAADVRGRTGPVILVGWGAALVPTGIDLLVLADLARWEIQQRQRAGAPNWRADNGEQDNLRKIKRGYFVEWRIADRHKIDILDRADFLLDTNASVREPKLITIGSFFAAMDEASSRPFRVVPFFDPGVWGGQWMKEVCGLDDDKANYAWCFDCVPEENSLLIAVDGQLVEVPALDLVLTRPRQLLGERTFARFGAEFPIRFDFLDTMEGGNLSLQVHPLTQYIQDRFGMHYTQDESYYLLDAAPDAVVYLGLKQGTEPEQLLEELRTAATGEKQFPAEHFVNAFPAKKHDHFSIPAGTVHCSGANSMVLEISATPYIFTFKMWDWGRVGLDGVPRPIHLEHAARNIQWDRDTDWVTEQLVDRTEIVAKGDGWIEERTGLHELEFIEVRRHWFDRLVEHHTGGTVNVLNLVEGWEATVESPTGAFEPFVVHYAETFIVPADVGAYTIRPSGPSEGQQIATVKTWVRGTVRDDETVAG